MPGEPRASNWLLATLAGLRCPHCSASNRSGLKPDVELDEHGQGFCNSCGQSFTVRRDPA